TGLAPLLSRWWQAAGLNEILYLYGISLVFSVPLVFFQFLCMANMNFKPRFFSNLVYQSVNFTLILLLYFFVGKVQIYQLPLIQATAALSGLIVIIFAARPYLRFTRKLDWSWVSRLFHFGKFVFATNMSSMLFKQMDILMIGYFINPVAVALYNVPGRVTNYVEVPMNSMASLVFPQAAKRIEEQGKAAVRYLYEKSVGTLLAVIVPIALVMALFAKEIILLIAGKDYLGAVPLLQVMAFLTILKPFGRQGGTILDSAGYPNYNFYSLLLSLFANVLLNWFFILHYGVMGAVTATVIAMFIGTLIQQFVLAKKLGINIHHPFIYMWVVYRDVFKKGRSIVHRA
ncbi:MAG TPA: oligosaccharide flippase family protein, partial [Gammaproteobacteria bacterium]|nr:oligosaccharide flippase family protein [Gammaproteobacteria bacterium]